VRDAGLATGKSVWMTETSGYPADWNGCIDYAMSIHAALYYGRVSGWVHWYGIDDLVTTTTLTKKGFAAKHYYRYVRPGASAVLTTVSNDNNVLVTAFKHDGDNTLTIVLINSGSSPSPITFTGSPPPDGDDVKAGYEFDVPCWFETDELSTQLTAYQQGEINVPIVEDKYPS